MTKKERIEEAIALLKDAVNIIEDCNETALLRKSKEEPQLTYEALDKVFDGVLEHLSEDIDFNDKYIRDDLHKSIELTSNGKLFLNLGGVEVVKLPELLSVITGIVIEELEYRGIRITAEEV